MKKMMIGLMSIVMLSLLVSGCGVQEKITSVKEKADSVKEKVESVKDTVDSVKENIDSVKENIDSVKESIEGGGMLDGLEIPPELLEQFDLNGIEQSLNGYGEKEAEGDITVFAKYKVEELIYESVEPEVLMSIEYRSSGELDEVIQYFDTVLKETNDYTYEDDYGPKTVMLNGTFDKRYVQVMIEDTEALIYVHFVYDYEQEDMYDDDEPMIVLSEEEIYAQQEEALKSLGVDSEIVVRQEVDAFDFEALIGDYYDAYVPRNLKATMEGTSKDSETGTDLIAYEFIYGNNDAYLASYINGEHMAVAIYNSQLDETCTYATFALGYKEIIEGNTIPFRLLDGMWWYEFEYGDEAIPTYIELDDGSRYIWVNADYMSFMYDFDERLMVWYEEHWFDSEGKYDTQWQVTDVQYDVELEEGLFEW